VRPIFFSEPAIVVIMMMMMIIIAIKQEGQCNLEENILNMRVKM
jgi:hypothetical protein